MKLAKSTLPSGHTFNDFKCFGPSATKDGEFSGTKIADFGCFDQSGRDSNKYYHACVCQSKINSNWFCFFQWGRTGKSSFDFQFIQCSSEQDAQKTYEKQCHSKNDKRGEWYEHPVLGKILRAKPKKDCYLVRNMAKRLSALPDACSITNVTTVIKKSSSSIFDKETVKLLNDLKVGTINYARNSFSSGMIPDLDSIEQARKILAIAASTKKMEELNELTKILYSKIPKHTYIGEKIELSSNNIKSWYDDLDAFENAYKSESTQSIEEISTKYHLKYIDKSNQLWYNIERLVQSSTRNRHSYIPGKIKILNIWEVTNIPKEFLEEQEKISKEFNNNYFPLIFQPERTELEKKSNCQILIHGSRTVNIGGILSTGFRLPKELSGVAINGAINGPAIYHAQDYKKSCGYCSIPNAYWSNGSGSINGRGAFIFINDVILGNFYLINKPRPENSPPKGYHSVIASGGSFQNEEFMVYQKERLCPRYLLEFTF